MNATKPFDRSTEDVSNIIRLEHVNVAIPDQRLATIFYISGLGLTRDPYLMTGITNMWVNVGASQFHLPLGQPQRLRGHIGLVVPDRASLLDRLSSVQDLLSGTRFGFEEYPDYIGTTCPWGNAIRCYEGHSPNTGDMTLGVRYVEFSVPSGCAESIVDFYNGIFSAPGRIESTADGVPVARICVGIGQELVFRETSEPIPP